MLNNFLQGRSLTRLKMILLFSSVALILFGVKLWFIHTNGNATPFGDQWDAEAKGLYQPYLDNKLGLDDLVAPHNEHRIVTTRILDLMLLNINLTWNPLLQMTVNAAIHVFTIFFCVFLFTRVAGKTNLPALFIFTLILFGVPYAWENTIQGFQVQFYFVFLFSCISLWLLFYQEPLSWYWWAGVFSGILSFLSLASGSFVFAAGALISFIIFITNIRRTPRQLYAIVILVAFFIISIKLTPTIEGHAQFKAASVRDFFTAATTVFGWPIAKNLFGAIIGNLPLLIFTFLTLRRPPSFNNRKWFLLALVVWVVIQGISIAYGRSTTPLSSRYRDLLAILILINFGCLLYISISKVNKWGNWIRIGAGLWTSIVLISLVLYSTRHLPDEINSKRRLSLIQEQNMKDYLMTRDASYLMNKPFLHIPYPDAERLLSILQLPGINEIMPANISAPLKPVSIDIKPAGSFIANGYYFTTPKRFDTAWGSYVLGVGDGATGEMTLKFNNKIGARTIEIPVAGYPLKDGIEIDVEQDGKTKRVLMETDPKETWSTARVSINKHDFAIHLKDTSTSTWLSIGNPVVKGRLDDLVNRILKNYYMFIILGLVGLIFLLFQQGFAPRSSNP